MFVLFGVLDSHRPGGANLRAGLDSSGLPEGEGPVAFVCYIFPPTRTLKLHQASLSRVTDGAFGETKVRVRVSKASPSRERPGFAGRVT